MKFSFGIGKLLDWGCYNKGFIGGFFDTFFYDWGLKRRYGHACEGIERGRRQMIENDRVLIYDAQAMLDGGGLTEFNKLWVEEFIKSRHRIIEHMQTAPYPAL